MRLVLTNNTSIVTECFVQGCGSAFIFCGSGSSCSSQCGSGSSCFFNAYPDPALTKFVMNYLPYEDFLELKKTKQIAEKLKTMELV